MKNLQKGFIVPLILLIISVLLVGAGAYVYTHSVTPTPVSSVNSNTTVTSTSTQTATESATKNWKTYTNTKYGFTFNYPPEANTNLLSQFVKIIPNTTECSNFQDFDQGKYPPELFHVQINGVDFQKAKLLGTSANAAFHITNYCTAKDYISYEMEWVSVDASGPNAQEYASTYTSKNLVGDLFVFDKIVSTFRFVPSKINTTTVSNVQLPTNCKDGALPNGTPLLPVITSIAPSSGPIGTQVEIKGCNLADLVGGLTISVENFQGLRTLFHADPGSTRTDLKFTLKSPACAIEYSGKPCSAYVTLKSGTYKVYALAREESNTATFTITP